MLHKGLILLLIALPVLVLGCASPTPAPTATPPGTSTTPEASPSPVATPAAGMGILFDETTTVHAGSYATYKVTVDYQKAVDISIKTDGAPIDCLVMYDTALQAYKDNVAGINTYFGYQKLYPNVVDAVNRFTSTNVDQAYYIVLDNTGKAGEANAGRDVGVHIKVEQL